jgi:uncharacterized protein YlzI (FlbEa/FlbD family)
MRNIEIKPDGVTVDLTQHELYMLKNAMNEVVNGIRIRGFKSRMGTTRREADILLDQLFNAVQASRASAATE